MFTDDSPIVPPFKIHRKKKIMIHMQTTIPVRNVFSGASVTGPQVNKAGAGGSGRSGAQASIGAGKSGQQALKTASGQVDNAVRIVANNNKANDTTIKAYNTNLKSSIAGFQSSLGSTSTTSTFTPASNPFSNAAGSTFNFAKATEASKMTALAYTNDNLLAGTKKADTNISTANNWGEVTGHTLEKAGAAIGGGMGQTIAGVGLVTSGITTAAAAGWTGIGLAAALAQMAAGVVQIGGGLTEGGNGQNEASQAQDYTAPQVDAATQAAIDQMLATGANNQAMQNLYQGLNLQALPALNGAQQGVNGLNGLLAQIDPSQASQANLTAGLPSVSGAPTSTASAPVDTSWNPPATSTPPTTPSSNLPGGSSTTASTWPTTSPDQTTAPTANGQEDPQLAIKQQFVTAFEEQQGNGNQATALAQGLTAQAPTGFNIAALGPLAVQDAGQNPPLTQAYERFKAEIEAKENGGQPNDAGVLQASTNPMAPAGGEGANGQAVAGNAQNGAPNGTPTAQGPVANAPVATAQGQPAPQATSVASAPAVANTWASPAPTAPGLTIPGQPVAKTPAPTATLGSSSPAIG